MQHRKGVQSGETGIVSAIMAGPRAYQEALYPEGKDAYLELPSSGTERAGGG